MSTHPSTPDIDGAIVDCFINAEDLLPPNSTEIPAARQQKQRMASEDMVPDEYTQNNAALVIQKAFGNIPLLARCQNLAGRPYLKMLLIIINAKNAFYVTNYA